MVFWLGVLASVGQMGREAGMRGGMAGPPEELPVPVLMGGLGDSEMAITTTIPQAQVWFTQGLNLLHDFWDYEAARAFEESVRLDPRCAMCYWGVYKAESFRGEESDRWAKIALDQAVRLGKGVSAPEKLYIKAAREEEQQRERKKRAEAKMGSKMGSKMVMKKAGGATLETMVHRDSSETKTLRKLVEMEPEDTQARIFLAESLMDGFNDYGTPKPGTVQGQAMLQGVLAAHPEDSAANHYWIHAMEPGVHPEYALRSAGRLGGLAPGSGHMVHMPGHIYYRTGDYERARVAFEASMRVDEAYMRMQRVGVAEDWNYVHNLMYLIADLVEAGRVEEATAVSAKLAGARGDAGPTLYRFSTRDGMTRLSALLPVALRSGDWTGATKLLEASVPDPALVNLVGLRTSLLEYTRGMAAVVAGDGGTAAKESAALEERMKTVPAEEASMPMGMAAASGKDVMAKPVHGVLAVAGMELRGSVLMAQGKTAEAQVVFDEAVTAERGLGYHEPPSLIRPVEETRGDALLRTGKDTEAKQAYAAALVERPNSGYALYGLAQADVAAKDAAGATAAYRALLKAWAGADAGLPQVQTAKAWMAGHGTAAGR